MKDYRDIYNEMFEKTNMELQKMIFDKEPIRASSATAILINRLLDRVYQLEKEVLVLSGQETRQRKRKIYYYCDVELTDKLLVEYIDTEAFTIYELEKEVGAKKNVLRGRYKRAKKRIQAQKCQNDK